MVGVDDDNRVLARGQSADRNAVAGVILDNVAGGQAIVR